MSLGHADRTMPLLRVVDATRTLDLVVLVSGDQPVRPAARAGMGRVISKTDEGGLPGQLEVGLGSVPTAVLAFEHSLANLSSR